MNHHFVYGNSSHALPHLMDHLLREGHEVGSRAGRTMELTHVGIKLERPWQRELLVPGRKHNLAAQIAETAWVLAGRGDVEWLARYLPRAVDFSDDGKVWRAAYGPRLRHWPTNGADVDQLAYVVETLRAAPSSRQAVMTLWDPAVDTTPGKDIACNNWLNFSSRLGKLDLHVVIRSNDAMWGWSGINAFEWSALQEIVAGLLGLSVGALHFSTTSFHLYDHHWKKAEEISRTRGVEGFEDSEDSPRFDGETVNSVRSLDALLDQWFRVEEAIRTGQPGAGDMVDAFPEPLFQSWLRVLAWWWTGDFYELEPLAGTRLAASAAIAVRPQQPDPVVQAGPSFLEYVSELHNDKHAAYGNSWKRRGEQIGILANIARKIDRLGTNSADETSTDTAIDLLVYLAKYRWWLSDNGETAPFNMNPMTWAYPVSDHAEPVNQLIAEVGHRLALDSPLDATVAELEEMLTNNFAHLEEIVAAGAVRGPGVDAMLLKAYHLAWLLWSAQ